MHTGFDGKAVRPFVVFSLYLAIAGIMAPMLSSDDQPMDPWSKGDLLEPAAFADGLRSGTTPLTIICVAFPSLYTQKHIAHAIYAGPGNKPEGLEALRKAVNTLPKSSDIVIYCGCCPMVKCPNLRPAYALLKELGLNRVRVLNIPTNLMTDWSAKGYPVE